ncbi:MAG: extensin family protein, partial [Comamonadaceae bacterium]
MFWKWFFAALLALLAGGAYGLYTGLWQLPDRLNPWAVLRIEEEPHWLTGHKLDRLSREPAQCLAVLETAAMGWQTVPDRSTGEDCGLRNAVRIERTRWAVGPAFTLACPAAVSLALWERHVVAPAAQNHLGSAPARLEHFGSYACRNVNHAAQGRRSEHATANALDIAGFVLADGRRIGVLRDWSRPGPEADFLRKVHAGACRFFDGVLGP